MLSRVVRVRSKASLTRAVFVRNESKKAELRKDSPAMGSGPTIKDDAEKVLAKARKVGEMVRSGQSPNREMTWTEHQRPRQDAFKGPRFEQTNLELQPQPQAAIEFIAAEPIRIVNKRIVSCDGGGGALGHPRIYINLDKNSESHSCNYCGIRFQMAHEKHDQLNATGGNH